MRSRNRAGCSETAVHIRHPERTNGPRFLVIRRLRKRSRAGSPRSRGGQTASGALLEHRLRQDQSRAELGELYLDHDLVFAEVDGTPLRPNHDTKTFTKPAKPAGVRRLRLHDLHHGRASLLLAAGVDIAVVSKVLGHASIRTTADTYSQLLAGVGRTAAEAVDSLIVRSPLRDQSVTTRGGETFEGPSRRTPKRASDLGE